MRRRNRAATIRCDPGFRIASSNRTTGQVDQVPHTEAFADFPRLRAAGCKETAEQPITARLSTRLCQFRALQFSRSKIPASSAEIEAFPWRMTRPV